MTDLVVVGLAYPEVHGPAQVRPVAGEEVFVQGMQLTLGGALNTASVAAALGLKRRRPPRKGRPKKFKELCDPVRRTG